MYACMPIALSGSAADASADRTPDTMILSAAVLQPAREQR